MSRTYRKLKSPKGNNQSAHRHKHLSKSVVKRERITDNEDEESFFMTIIKNGYRQKVEIKEAIWGKRINSYRTSLLLDTRSGVNNLPKHVRNMYEKEYRAYCKNSLFNAMRKCDGEDYAPEDIRIVHADWWW